ncbi:MAG: tRNA 2-selenouridine(34) synthase MnmH [Pseudomonadota bacterium]
MSERELVEASEFGELLTAGIPLVDLRAPVEFAGGAFPAAVNLWLMDDRERAEVGTCYKRRGHDAAVALGHELVSGAVRERRMRRWISQLERDPETLFYCFRGGQRSELVQAWLSEAGFPTRRIAGGYKALRRFALTRLAELCESQRVLVLGGLAGSGKTDLLSELPATVDLEGHANHRGSAFGRRVAGQPAPIDFEHRLIIDWINHERQGYTGMITEDESRTIGRLALPQPLWDTLVEAPIAVVDEPFDDRVQRIIRDYVERNLADCRSVDPVGGFAAFSDELLASLARVEKRLGGERYAGLHRAMVSALEQQRAGSDTSVHAAWVEPLLRDYYDPMYEWQLEKKMPRVVFRGSANDVAEYARSKISR